MIPSFRAILPRPPNFGTLRLFAGSVRAVSSHAALTQLLLPVSDGVEEDAERELRWMKEEIQRIQHINRNLSEPEQHSRLEEMVRERAQGKPLQYVLGTHPFGPLLLAVRPPILIPRPETEEWAIHLASLLHPTPSTPPGRRLRILDLCTGTGCIPLLLCASLPAGTVQARGVDILPEAVELARENASLLEKEANTFEVIQRDVFSEGSLEEMMGQGGWVNPDVLTSNPPYIPRDEMLKLDKSVSEYESHLALAGDVPESFSPSSIPPALSHLAPLRGLDFYHHIGMLISRGLVRSPIAPTRAPQIVLEVGHDQAREVEEILLLGPAGSRVERTERWTDFAGKERVVAGWLKESGDEGGVTEVREGVGRDQK